MNTENQTAGDGPAERGVRPALDSEALLHAAKCRTWAAKTFNDTPDAALCVEAGDRLLYAAQLLDAQALEINRLRATVAAEQERWTLLLTEKWHGGDGKRQKLSQYMGMTETEYAAWVMKD